MPTLFPDEAKSVIEALLFVSGDPLTAKDIAEILCLEEKEVLNFLKEIKADCEKERRGFCLVEVAGGFAFSTRPEHAAHIEKLVRPRLSSLSQAALETLAIIAYQQPVARSEIEEIRGVKCESAINTLLERGLIEEGGRRETPGRPILYRTTPDFLKYLGIRSLEDLPALKRIEAEEPDRENQD
ncbi:MAG: SMC-Scp complex subunit ScpB [Peptococcaceae bacterium]|nr:SMC-Scp complex subunit ScpB [Peptococcaceae bacterium]MDH7525928.1 SMC-Scp complex subunit ScpB [Peptococcaceae bacterium]